MDEPVNVPAALVGVGAVLFALLAAVFCLFGGGL